MSRNGPGRGKLGKILRGDKIDRRFERAGDQANICRYFEPANVACRARIEKPPLYSPECDSVSGTDGIIEWLAGIGIQPGRDIHRQHRER